MGTVLTIIIVLGIAFYAYKIITRYVNQVREGKCMSCTVKKGEDCHCHRVDSILGYEEREQKIDEEQK